ncbi:MAG: TolC family protein, partial [Segetibacter sp.]|nr:TolC family protein [Segetibacter sp.]
MKTLRLVYFILYFVSPVLLFAQNSRHDTLLQQAGLQDCIQYALRHQPLIQQSKIDEEITETTIKTKLSEWYPQVNA